MSTRALLAELHAHARAAVHGEAVVRDALAAGGGEPLEDRPPDDGPLIALAVGKAACEMARGARAALRARLVDGLVTAKRGYAGDPAGLPCLEAGHPLPDEASVDAARRALELAASAHARGAGLLVLLSGGASALWCAPAPGLSLDDKRRTTDLLLRSGADIAEINTVRKHLSALKGGQLARAAQPAPVWTLAISDVRGDAPDRIGSGPTVPDPTRFADALRVLESRGLTPRVPASVRAHLQRGASGACPDTPTRLERARFRCVARLADALEAARAEATRRGLSAECLPGALDGDVRQVARALAARVRVGRGPELWIAGGEPVVHVTGSGRGGRCQELALAFALELGPEVPVTALFAGTDGSDGPTDAAGAFADARLLERARAAGCDPEAHLANNDSHPLLAATGDLYRTGPTGTNVTDVALLLCGEAC